MRLYIAQDEINRNIRVLLRNVIPSKKTNLKLKKKIVKETGSGKGTRKRESARGSIQGSKQNAGLRRK